MFRGLSHIHLDAKGRITLPQRHLDALEAEVDQQFVITLDPEQRCLWLYPLETWEALETRIARLPMLNPAAKVLQRLLIGHAVTVDMQKANRLTLPKSLMQYADLDKHVVLVGQGDYFEIWDLERWQSAKEEWLQTPLRELSEEPLSPELEALYG